MNKLLSPFNFGGKGISPSAAAAFFLISITLIGTTYYFTEGITKKAMAETFEVIGVYNDRFIIRNTGTQPIEKLKTLVDGVEVSNEMNAIQPNTFGTVNLTLEGMQGGRHELMIISESMSQKLLWELETVETYMEIIQSRAEIDKPVKWTSKIDLKNRYAKEIVDFNVNLGIPEDAKEIVIKNINNETLFKDRKSFKMNVAGNTIVSYFVEYETPAPYKEETIEQFISGEMYKKRIIVKSRFVGHYEDVVARTEIPEELSKKGYAIRLYQIRGNSRIDVTEFQQYNVSFVDSNNNGLIDRIKWVVPELSDQTFDVEATLSIINVQSYPTLSGNWTVVFNTTGRANLTITAINGTVFDRDIEFLELRCGNITLNPDFDGERVFYQDYYCNETGYEISEVLAIGKHTLEFRFGDDVDYAYNDVVYLEVSLLNPNPNTCTETSPCTWQQGNDYPVNATVKCKVGSCGTIYGSSRYNISQSGMALINTTSGAEPFYIVGGGSSGGGQAMNNWTNLNPPVSPQERSKACMAYDPNHNVMVLFGGLNVSTNTRFNDTWVLNYSASNGWRWYNVTNKTLVPGNFPPKREKCKMVYYSSVDRFIMFGGFNVTTRLNDTWEYDYNTNTWKDLSEALPLRPRNRDFFGMTYDSNADRAVIFGGTPDGTVMLGDTWVFNYTDKKWYVVTPSPSPTPREELEMTYDSDQKKTILFGGLNAGTSQRFNDTWELNFTQGIGWKWRNITEALSKGGNTPLYLRTDHSMAYDSESKLTILFGGYTTQLAGNDRYLNDTWLFNYTDKTWYNSVPRDEIPSRRQFAAMAYNSMEDLTIMFGGYNLTGVASFYLGDTWSYEYSLGGKMVNPASCDPLSQDQSCQLNWTVGVTASSGYYKIDANFSNSSSGPGKLQNSTRNATIKIMPSSPSYCDEVISSLSDTYTISQSNKYYCVVNNLYIEGKNAINFSSGVQNSTLDCLNYNIDSNDVSSTYGAYLNGSNTKNNTIKNCDITGFYYGVYLYNGPSNNTFTNNLINSNTYGINTENSNNNTFTNNLINSNTYNAFDCKSNSNYNIIANNTGSNNGYGLRFWPCSYNTIINNTFQGFELQGGSTYNMFMNNTVNNNFYGFYIVDSNSNNITGGSIANNYQPDYDFYLTNSKNNYFKSTNFTTTRTIRFNDQVSVFNYDNSTTIELWLNTNVSAPANITRKLINWNQSLMQWNDSTSETATARYNITGLKSNKYYVVYNDSYFIAANKTNSLGELPSFTINLTSPDEHEIRVEEDQNPPQYFDNATNNTVAGYMTEFRARWTDNAGLDSYIFYLDNCTNQLKKMNETKFNKYGEREDWSKESYLINSTVGCNITWRFEANDTSGYWNKTLNYTFRASFVNLPVELITPSPSVCNETNPCDREQNKTYDVLAKVTCQLVPPNYGASCGEIRGYLRYNKTSSKPDTLIDPPPNTPLSFVTYFTDSLLPNIISNLAYKAENNSNYYPSYGLNPFTDTDYYEVNVSDGNRVNASATAEDPSCTGTPICINLYNKGDCETSCGCFWTGSQCKSPSYIFCSEHSTNQTECGLCGCSWSTSQRYAHLEFSFNLSSYKPNSIKNITYFYRGYRAGTGVFQAYLQYYNKSGGKWYIDQNIGGTEANYNKAITSVYDLIDQNGLFYFSATGKSNASSSVTVYANYVNLTVNYNSSNPATCGNLTIGQSCTIQWEINTSGNPGTGYKLDVNFSSKEYGNPPNNAFNDTDDAVIRITEKFPPQWSNNKTSPASPVIYQPNQKYQFNITWIDNTGIDNVIFEWNGVNKSSFKWGNISKYGNEYNLSFKDLPVGNYYYRWYANDTFNNWNSTNPINYQVSIAPTNITLYLNETGWIGIANKTYPNATIVNATINISSLQINVELDRNRVNLPSYIDEVLLGVGNYNYTGYYTGNSNYSSSITTRFLNITPGFSNVTLYLNETRGNFKMNVTGFLNTTAVLVQPSSGFVQIWTNYSGGWYNWSFGNSPLENITQINQLGIWNFTANFTRANYTPSFDSYYVNVTEWRYLVIESIQIQPQGDIQPISGGNVRMNVTVNVTTNTTPISVCEVRILNSTDTYSNPSKGPLSGLIQTTGSKVQCFQEWYMEYWRNPEQLKWNVSVKMNLTAGINNFTSQNFTYKGLADIVVNVSTINYTGAPGQTVNSYNAYPLSINNTGNLKVDVFLNGTDFIGTPNSGYVIGVGNASYNESTTGTFINLTYNPGLVFKSVFPAQVKYLYFRAYLPLGFIGQNYTNFIRVNHTEST